MANKMAVIQMQKQRWKLKGVMLLTTVVAVVAWIILAGAVFFTQSSQFQLLMASQQSLQAKMYAEADAKLLRFVNYDMLTNPSELAKYKLHTGRGDIQIADAPGWEDELSIGSGQSTDSGGVPPCNHQYLSQGRDRSAV